MAENKNAQQVHEITDKLEQGIKDSGYFYQTVIETNGETIF